MSLEMMIHFHIGTFFSPTAKPHNHIKETCIDFALSTFTISYWISVVWILVLLLFLFVLYFHISSFWHFLYDASQRKWVDYISEPVSAKQEANTQDVTSSHNTEAKRCQFLAVPSFSCPCSVRILKEESEKRFIYSFIIFTFRGSCVKLLQFKTLYVLILLLHNKCI